jgi:UDP-N-acetylglucosamine acyltransferase
MGDSVSIHPTALIDSSAVLRPGVVIGPYVVVEADVEIGANSRVAAHAVIKRYTQIGERNQIAEHAVIGGDPQDYAFQDCISRVEIGNDNRIREGVTIHRGGKPGTVTRIGNGNFLMAQCHVAHDCQVADNVVICNAALLAGYVQVGSRAFISGAVGIHQFCRVGRLAMIGSNSKVDQDCLPFVTISGVPGRARGINVIGLKRAGYSAADVRAIKLAYKGLMSRDGGLDDRLEELAKLAHPAVMEMVEFVRDCERGFIHTRAIR